MDPGMEEVNLVQRCFGVQLRFLISVAPAHAGAGTDSDAATGARVLERSGSGPEWPCSAARGAGRWRGVCPAQGGQLYLLSRP